MIFRLSQKLNTKIKARTLPMLPLDENPFADWSAGLFLVGRTQYILVTNTKSLYSTVVLGKGVTDEKTFIERALSSIGEFMEADGQQGVYERLVARVSGSVRFAKALNRSVTGSMNDMTRHAAYWLAAGDVSPIEIGSRLDDQGEPQSSYWLASLIVEMKLWRASEADVRDVLNKDIQRNGEQSRFLRLADDEFALRSWTAE